MSDIMNRKGVVEFWSDWFKGFFVGLIVGVILALAAQYFGYLPALSPPTGGGQGTQAGIGLLAFALKNQK